MPIPCADAATTASTPPDSSLPFLTVAFYRYAALPDPAALQQALLACCERHHVKGAVLLAAEGINGTLAGTPQALGAVLQLLRAQPALATLEGFATSCARVPYRRLKVRLKREIVTFGAPGLAPARQSGQPVPPSQWNRLLEDRPDLVLIDARNAFEVALGSFAGAVDPRTARFSDLPQWLERQRASGGLLAAKPAVAMFCTGGIRCEKATAYLRAQGFAEVYQLQGGILGYLAAEVPAAQSRWRGECFVFDERVSVSDGLQAVALAASSVEGGARLHAAG